MVAYSFAPMFAEPVAELRKRQTVRAEGLRRHARPGETVQLYTGMRTRHCRKLLARDPTCTSVTPIAITIDPKASLKAAGRPIITTIAINGETLSGEAMEAFACADGFPRIDGLTSLQRMGNFWLEHHGAHDFRGVLIKWEPR